MLIYLSSLFFALMGVLVKWLSTGAPIHPDQVSFMRSVIPALLLTPALFEERRRLGERFRGVAPYLLLRGLLGSAALIFYFRSIALIEFSNAALLCYTSPVFAGVFAAVFLREPLPRRSLAAFGVAFTGVVLALRPTVLLSGTMPPQVIEGTLYGLAAGLTAGGSYTTVRHLAGICSTTAIMAAFTWTGAALCLPMAIEAWHAPTPLQWLGLLGVAAMATVAQWLMTEGYRRYATAHASTMNLSIVVFATVLGAVFFREIPSGMQVAGIALTIMGLALAGARTTRQVPAEVLESEV